jgi:hypothetical protein
MDGYRGLGVWSPLMERTFFSGLSSSLIMFSTLLFFVFFTLAITIGYVTIWLIAFRYWGTPS